MPTCPMCSLVSPESAVMCDCAFVFDSAGAERALASGFRPQEQGARRGGHGKRALAILAAALLSIPAVFLASGVYFRTMALDEYKSGARASTDGDSIMIPMVGVTAAWIVVLAIGTGVVAIGMEMRRSRGRGTG